jgi:hypothetical protein
LPFLGVQFPAITFPGPEPPEWWPFEAHPASELEEQWSSWPQLARYLRLSSEAFLRFPGFGGE